MRADAFEGIAPQLVLRAAGRDVLVELDDFVVEAEGGVLDGGGLLGVPGGDLVDRLGLDLGLLGAGFRGRTYIFGSSSSSMAMVLRLFSELRAR